MKFRIKGPSAIVPKRFKRLFALGKKLGRLKSLRNAPSPPTQPGLPSEPRPPEPDQAGPPDEQPE